MTLGVAGVGGSPACGVIDHLVTMNGDGATLVTAVATADLGFAVSGSCGCGVGGGQGHKTGSQLTIRPLTVASARPALGLDL